MLLNDPQRQALVADISSSALSKAQALLGRHGLADRAVFSVADGLNALDACVDWTPDTIFVLGMGGETVSNILQNGRDKLHGAALILGAQTELPSVRMALVEIGYRIRREIVAYENKRDYILIRAEIAEDQEAGYTEEEILLGPGLLRELPHAWTPVLARRLRLLEQGIQAMTATGNARDAERLALFLREKQYVQNALSQIAPGKDESSHESQSDC